MVFHALLLELNIGNQNNLSVPLCSIDQFFECFEGMRSSQMVSGNSGIWNWTCSVFNAITFANTLASGVNHLPPGFPFAYHINVFCFRSGVDCCNCLCGAVPLF
jgi:hypothetical protein